jgi:hypothetical protein
MLCGCTFALIVEFKQGVFFRGGIEVEIATKLTNGDIYGPALSEVHRLEKEVAQYPRVVIGNRLSQFIHGGVQRSDSGEFLNSVLLRVNDLCKGFVCSDDDGKMIVDYLGKTASDLSQFQGSKACDFVKRGMSRIKNELDVARKEGDGELVKRYEKLLAYYQSRTKYWNWDSIDVNFKWNRD